MLQHLFTEENKKKDEFTIYDQRYFILLEVFLSLVHCTIDIEK